MDKDFYRILKKVDESKSLSKDNIAYYIMKGNICYKMIFGVLARVYQTKSRSISKADLIRKAKVPTGYAGYILFKFLQAGLINMDTPVNKSVIFINDEHRAKWRSLLKTLDEYE